MRACNAHVAPAKDANVITGEQAAAAAHLFRQLLSEAQGSSRRLEELPSAVWVEAMQAVMAAHDRAVELRLALSRAAGITVDRAGAYALVERELREMNVEYLEIWTAPKEKQTGCFLMRGQINAGGGLGVYPDGNNEVQPSLAAAVDDLRDPNRNRMGAPDPD